MFDNSIIKQINKGGFDSVLGEFCKGEDGKPDFDEIHSVAYGFMVSINPRQPRFKLDDIPDDYPQVVKDVLIKEHHYYTAGRTLGDCLKVIIIGILGIYGFTVIL